jgi:hypothetical protein
LQNFPGFSKEARVLCRHVGSVNPQSSQQLKRVKMGKARRQTEATGRRPTVLLTALSILLGLTGCAGDKEATTADPLLGPPVKAPPKTAAAPAPNQPQVASLPPLPSTGPGTSTAALAGLQRPGGMDNDLRIPNSNGTANGWGGPPQPIVDTAVLHRPEATADTASIATPRAATQPTPAQAPAPGSFTTYEQALQELKTRGVLWHRLELIGDTGEWRFSCSVPNRQTTRLRRTYMANNRDYLAAIRSVLDQIDHDR